MQQRKTPMRMCVGCGEMKPKQELIRVLKTPENEICIDLKGKKNGRGAYICSNKDCLAKAIKSKRLERAFGMPISEEIYASLRQELQNEQ